MKNNADAISTNKDKIRLEIEPGSNEGSYITLYEGACWIMSWRYTCYNPDSPEIKKELKAIAQMLHLN